VKSKSFGELVKEQKVLHSNGPKATTPTTIVSSVASQHKHPTDWTFLEGTLSSLTKVKKIFTYRVVV
jgi:hypothetical protein